MPELKLFMILLGCRVPDRHIEQHDFFFGIATSIKEMVPYIKIFWPEAADRLHIDAWREITTVDGYRVRVVEKPDADTTSQPKLFFINLGGYQENKFEEQHYTIITVKRDKAAAFKEAKETFFYKHHTFQGTAVSHIDDKFGIDVDDLYQIEDILPAAQKEKYSITISPSADLAEDEMHLGYIKLSTLV
jgi:hypothetical protein